MVAHQAPLFMGFPRQEYWSLLPFPPSGDLLDPGIEGTSPALVGGFFKTEPQGKPLKISLKNIYVYSHQGLVIQLQKKMEDKLV